MLFFKADLFTILCVIVINVLKLGVLGRDCVITPFDGESFDAFDVNVEDGEQIGIIKAKIADMWGYSVLSLRIYDEEFRVLSDEDVLPDVDDYEDYVLKLEILFIEIKGYEWSNTLLEDGIPPIHFETIYALINHKITTIIRRIDEKLLEMNRPPREVQVLLIYEDKARHIRRLLMPKTLEEIGFDPDIEKKEKLFFIVGRAEDEHILDKLLGYCEKEMDNRFYDDPRTDDDEYLDIWIGESDQP